MKKRIVCLMLGTFLAFTLAGCAGKPSNTEQPSVVSLEGTSWILERVQGSPAVQDHPVTFNVSGGRVGGSAGCNRYYGEILEGPAGELRIDRLSWTLKACYPHEVMVQENQFLEALRVVVTHSLVGDKLMLKNASGQVLAVLAPQSQELEGTSWRVTGYNDGSAITSPVLGSELTVVFEGNGKITGSAGCNTYFGTYGSAVSGKTLSIGQTGLTEMMCHEPGGVMPQENMFMAALVSTITYQLDGQKLTLIKPDGSVAVNLTRY